ncbi:hypothetical protein [Actinomyces glycerinitolerans]|uniref:Secreted protein n=1 Tax=Actinomyces glycerinitolerans TaxID=1892869 RepID=A0A1M4S0A5_9ACTO|nr:hypothetical protein [Actinomyces glycerinitolerans]SHE25653.1 Hypothetical protein ACGLYG10_1883 [Actinomyces glycerinitolerans]
MRRRTVLTAAALGAVGSLIGLPACSVFNSPSAAPTPSPAMPPGPDAVPDALSDQHLWPGGSHVRSTVTAVREHFLTGAVQATEATAYVQGMCPVVVDLNGPTTWGVLLDDDGRWTTRQVVPDSKAGPGERDPDDNQPTTMLVAGPAVIDDTHAYTVVAALAGVPYNQEYYSQPDDACPVSLLKVDLADGSLDAVTTVSESWPASAIRHLCLSFTQDRAGLLLTGAPDTDEGSFRKETYAHIGLRLSTEDLSVELDSHDLLRGRGYDMVSPCGQAVVGKTEFGREWLLVCLEDGTLIRPSEDAYPHLVRDGWFYYQQERSLRAQELGSKEAITVTDMDIQTSNGSYWPEIYSDQPEIIQIGRSSASGIEALRVLRPGQTTPIVSWNGEDKVPDGACVCGDVLYAWYQEDASGHLRVEMISLSEGEEGDALGTCETGEMTVTVDDSPVVTAWGVAVGDRFYAATQWLDGVPQQPTGTASPGPASPQASSSPTG